MIKKYLGIIFFAFYASIQVNGQNDTTVIIDQPIDTIAFQIAESKKPVTSTWASTLLVDAQTTHIPPKGSFEVLIQHRFSNLENGIKDLFGIYGASNIRLAVQYSILNQLMIGFGTEKDKKYQELFIKGNILEQNRKGSMPLSLTFFGNAALNAREKAYFGNNYKFTDRMSYFAQFIISRKFNSIFSLQTSLSYSHNNTVEGYKVIDTIINSADSANSIIRTSYLPLYQHGIFGLSAGAKINFYRGMSILLEYDQGFFLKKAESQQLKPKPNLAIALEIATSTHCFQIFASSYRGIVPQQNYSFNQMDFKKTKGVMIGFNITVRLN